MPTPGLKPIVIDDLTGGRSGQADPFSLPPNQCVEAVNVDHFTGRLARKRGGATAVSTTGGTAFGSGMQTLIRHVPGLDEALAEFWGVDGAGLVKRLLNGTTWADVALADAIATRPQDVVGATLNGKLFLAYDSTVDRLHVFAPVTTVVATGGSITTVGAYTIHTFTGTDTLTVTSGGAVDYLVVGGGGGAGGNDAVGRGGGGGGGRVVTGSDTLTAGAYAITVGAGGAAYVAGSSSVFNAHTAAGGGHGGGVGDVGGGGGGGGGDSTTITGAAGAFGGNGSNGRGNAAPDSVGGGGGGSTGAAGAATAGVGGAGGAGTSSSLSGAAVTYAGGGGGGAVSGGGVAGAGGTGGGGAGSAVGVGTAGTANLGGGGGGGKDASAGGAGGSGVVIVRYLTTNPMSVRRVGLAAPTVAPTAANTAVGGAYAATLRYYRTRNLDLNGAVTVRRSEPSASVSFTPSGAFTGVVVTQPAVINEGETHWEVEVSLDNATFYRLAQVVIATTTYTDSAATTTYSTNTLSDPAGFYGLVPSAKYLITDGNRLLMTGSWEPAGLTSGGKTSWVWYTPVLGSADKGDDERVPMTTTQKNYLPLNENAGGGNTGIAAVNGVPYVGKYREIWRLNPTGDVAQPYLPRKISDAYGFLNHKSLVNARDHVGNPAIGFLSPDGPCRIVVLDGYAAVHYLGRDVEDLWATLNRGATSVVSHGIYHPDKHQVWWWIATGSSNDPDLKLCFDVLLGKFTDGERIQGGWTKHDGLSAGARCSVLMSNTLGASMSRDLKPYLGRSSGTAIWKCDTADLDDAGTAFQGYVTTRPILTTTDLLHLVGVSESTLVAKVQAATTVGVSIVRDFGKETITKTVSLAADTTETRIVRKVDGSGLGEARVVQMTIGDETAVASGWTLDALITPLTVQELA